MFNCNLASKIPDYSKIVEKEKGSREFSYKTLPDKILMGYNCKGIEVTNNDFVIVFYYTKEAKVSFDQMFKSQQNQKTPDAFKKYFKAGDNPLMMRMIIRDLKNKGRITTMECVALEKNAYSFIKSDYKFM